LRQQIRWRLAVVAEELTHPVDCEDPRGAVIEDDGRPARPAQEQCRAETGDPSANDDTVDQVSALASVRHGSE